MTSACTGGMTLFDRCRHREGRKNVFLQCCPSCGAVWKLEALARAPVEQLAEDRALRLDRALDAA